MANYYAEAKKGMGRMIPPSQGIYEESSTAKADLGDRLAFEDGRIFRYAKAGATALAAGKLCKIASLVAQTNKAASAAAALGAYAVTLTTSSAITTGTDGMLIVETGTGAGLQYKIKSSAANATTATSTDLVLYDPIATALDATSYCAVLYNPFEQLEVVSSATQVDLIIGVPPIAVTEEYYFWVQTWGQCALLSEGTPAAGYTVFPSYSTSLGGTSQAMYVTATTGASIPAPIVGTQWQLGVNGYYKSVFLQIMP